MTTTTRPVDESYASWIERCRAVEVLAIANYDDGDSPVWALDALGVAAEDVDCDTAAEYADGLVYDVTEYGKRVRDVTGDRSWMVTSIELLLGGGGPTITATLHVDEDCGVERITYWHSWGESPGHEATLESVEPAHLSAAEALLRMVCICD